MSDETQKRIVVFGGSGFIGRQVVSKLMARNYCVRIVTRNSRKYLAANPANERLEVVETDIGNEAQIEKAIEGGDAIINLVGILFQTRKQSFELIHHKVPAAMARACSRVKIERFIHISAIGADKTAKARYAQTKGLGEEAIFEACPSAIILRPSLVFGPEDQFFNRFARMSRFSPFLPLIGGGDTLFQPVFVGDVAKAIINALEGKAEEGQIYELGGAEVVSFRALMQMVLNLTHRHRILLPIPTALAYGMALFGEILPNPPLTRDQVLMLGENNIVSASAWEEKRTIMGLCVNPERIQVILDKYI